MRPDRRAAVTESPTGRDGRATLLGRLVLGGGVAAAVSVPFTVLALLVVSEWEPLADLDRDVADDLHEVVRRDDALADVLRFGAVATDPWVLRVVVAAVVVWLWRRGARRLAVWAATTTVVGGLLGALLKVVVERARPTFPDPVHTTDGYSFPSGHALNSFLIVGVLLVVFLPVLGTAGRILVTALGVAVVLFTGYDRIGLGVHYVSDVLSGWAAAIAVLAGTLVGFDTWRREHGLRPSSVTADVNPRSAHRATE